MKFFRLQTVEDDSQEGPSISGFRDGYDTWSANSATHIGQYRKLELRPDLDFVLADYGKATDSLQVSGIYSNHLFASPRFHEILTARNLLEHQCFKAIVRDGRKVLDYYFRHFYFRFDSDDNGLVDFTKTTFVASKITDELSIFALPADEEGIEGEFQVNSWKEFHALRGRRENDCWHKVIIPAGELHITQRWFLDLDLFYLEFGNASLKSFIVSEKLAEIISDAELTGIRLTPLRYDLALP